MDADTFYPLVPRSPTPEDATTMLLDDGIVESPPTPEEHLDALLFWLRQCLIVLLFLLLLAVAIIRRLRLQMVLLRQQSHYWQSQHRRAKQREHKLQQEVELLHGQIRELQQRLFGRKSETAATTTPNPTTATTKPTRSRGQQRGAKGPTRRSYDHLPTTHEPLEVPADQQRCPNCGEPWQQLPGSDDGQILEVEVRAHRRVYHRHRYAHT